MASIHCFLLVLSEVTVKNNGPKWGKVIRWLGKQFLGAPIFRMKTRLGGHIPNHWPVPRGEPGVWLEITPSRQFVFGLGGIANCWTKAGCFIGGLKAPHADAGPIHFASDGEAKRLGTFSGRGNTPLLLSCMEYSRLHGLVFGLEMRVAGIRDNYSSAETF